MSPRTVAKSSLQLGFDALDAAAARTSRQQLLERLAPVALELAQRAARAGITVSNLRFEAVRRGLLPQRSKERELSFLGAVMRKAKLIATDRWRRSDIDRSHGNNHRVWVAPGFET